MWQGIYILLLNKEYSQLTLGYSRTTALILVTAPILFILLSVTGALPPYPHKLLCTKVWQKTLFFASYPVFAAEPNSVQLQAGVFAP